MEVVRRVCFDTNIFLGIFLEEKDKVAPSLQILQLLSNGDLEGVVSSISLIEIATLFYQKGETQKGKKAVDLVRALPNITIVDVTADMALQIADMKVSEKLSIADAAVLTSATELRSDIFLTYDNDFEKVKKIKCMKPEEYLEAVRKKGLG